MRSIFLANIIPSLRDQMESYGPYINEQLMGKALKGCTDRVFVTSKFGHKYIKEWQSRPIESMYTIVWLDPMHYKVKEDGRTESRLTGICRL